jgi:H+/Cl- antiporter ClcA
MADESGLGGSPTATQARGFWHLIGYAVVLGAFGAVAGLVFLGVTGVGSDWYGDPDLGWFDGPVWWIAVAAGAGLVVGILRRVFGTPQKTPGIIDNLQSQHVDSRLVPSIVAISAVSLLGGASLGPEVALGSMGGGAGDVIAKRKNLDDDDAKANTLSGIAGAFGGLFSSPLMAVVLVLEIARPGRKVGGNAFFGSVVSSSVSFGIYFAIAGSLFLGLYEVPPYDYEDWHLFAGVALGLLAAAIAMLTVAVAAATARVVSRLKTPDLLRPVLGGLVFGLIGVALPLTNFTGSDQLDTALENGGTLGVGLLVAVLFGKMVTFAVSSATGFIGGPIFPILFIGGITGIIVHEVIPDIPLGLTFACMLAAVPGAIVPAPFSMVLLAALLTQVGTIQTAPILIAVATASLAIAGVRFLVANRTPPPTAAADQHQ